jgi:hypothetical protein
MHWIACSICQRCRPARPLASDKECIVEQWLTIINLATDVVAMTAAVASLVDIVLRRRSGGEPAK